MISYATCIKKGSPQICRHNLANICTFVKIKFGKYLFIEISTFEFSVQKSELKIQHLNFQFRNLN